MANEMGIFGSPFLCSMGDVAAKLEELRKVREAEEQARIKQGISTIHISFRGRTEKDIRT